MARSNSVLLYGMRGRLGDVVLCYSKGCTYIRRRPQKSTKPLTDTQITQRKRFAACVLFFRSVEAVGLKPAWQAAARGKRWSAFNLFIKVNLHNFTSEGHILDFEQLLLTPEKRSAPPHLHVVHREDGCVDVDWYAEEAPWRGRLRHPYRRYRGRPPGRLLREGALAGGGAKMAAPFPVFRIGRRKRIFNDKTLYFLTF